MAALALLVSPALADYPQRIVSTMPSITEMLFALELDDKIVGVTTNCNYPPAAKKKEKIGSFSVNLEKVVSLKPDLVVMFESAQQKEVKTLKNYGLPVWAIDPTSLDGVMQALLELGKKTGKETRARRIVSEMKRRLDRAKNEKLDLTGVLTLLSPEKKRRDALVIVGYNPLIVASRASFVDDVVRRAGLENIVSDPYPYPQYSLERIVQTDPNFIVIAEGTIKKGELQRDGRWRSLTAVKNGRVFFVDPDILTRPGPRAVEAVEVIAKFANLK